MTNERAVCVGVLLTCTLTMAACGQGSKQAGEPEVEPAPSEPAPAPSEPAPAPALVSDEPVTSCPLSLPLDARYELSTEGGAPASFAYPGKMSAQPPEQHRSRFVYTGEGDQMRASLSLRWREPVPVPGFEKGTPAADVELGMRSLEASIPEHVKARRGELEAKDEAEVAPRYILFEGFETKLDGEVVSRRSEAKLYWPAGDGEHFTSYEIELESAISACDDQLGALVEAVVRSVDGQPPSNAEAG
ncbi:hypothetical protein G6O69_33945 [Pseudenhygromyxa sp. WMMC2535]|uniref:hypothetical protein n=1 Tax=Pseudenhygromyxa sp. WMMC2535 TaxID=2712867 RepID=UPI00155609D6|nr:hypothetical protein [Pseudenhygromyxa sp. WMMC2535]NVB42873.1 hypothetical protein [Pseudenhygromyxa sp. WMMC2535]